MPPAARVGKRRGRAGSALLATFAVALALTLGGCTAVRGTISTLRALNEAGYTNASVSAEGPVVDVRVRRDSEDLTAAAREAAGIVWQRLPFPIRRIEVVCKNGFGGTGSFSATRSELEAAFGPRDPKLDEGVDDGDVRRLGVIVIGVLVLGFLVLVAIVVGIVLIVRRNKATPSAPPPPPGSPGGPPPPYHPPS